MAKYSVSQISETKANGLAEAEKPAFKCSTDGNYYTYTDVATGTPAQINDNQNDNMFIITWNGSAPVLTGRKMFPR